MQIRNRIVMSPMQQYSSENGLANDWHLVHLGSRAVGGVGLIVSECTAVSPEGRGTPGDTGLWNDQQAESWRPIVEFVQRQGARIAMQLGHFGGKGSKTLPKDGMKELLSADGGWQTVSSSPVLQMGSSVQPVELSTEEIEVVQQRYVAAAKRAIEIGFDAIEIHAAHGYLIHQFYSSLVNQRSDDYGGSFDNRVRFLLEVVQKVRQEMPEGMPLLVKISTSDYSEDTKAWTPEDSVRLVNHLKKLGVDLVTASAGGFVRVDKSIVGPSYQVPFAEQIKKETEMKVGAVGMITEPHQAQEIIKQGKADLVLLARQYLRDPYFALNAARVLEEETEKPLQYKRAF